MLRPSVVCKTPRRIPSLSRKARGRGARRLLGMGEDHAKNHSHRVVSALEQSFADLAILLAKWLRVVCWWCNCAIVTVLSLPRHSSEPWCSLATSIKTHVCTQRGRVLVSGARRKGAPKMFYFQSSKKPSGYTNKCANCFLS